MKSKKPDSSNYLTTEQLGQRLGFSVTTLRRWRVEGKGPRFINPGGKKALYSILEIEQFERMNTKRSTVG